MKNRTLADMSDIELMVVFGGLRDEEKIAMYYTCKRFHKKRLLQLNGPFIHCLINYPSLLDCVASMEVEEKQLDSILSKLYNAGDAIKLKSLKIIGMRNQEIPDYRKDLGKLINEGVIEMQFNCTFTEDLEIRTRMNDENNNNNNSIIKKKIKLNRPMMEDITYIRLTSRFDKQLINDYKLPSNLVHLITGNSFNHAIKSDHLPRSLQYLELGDGYNLPLDTTLSITKLKLLRLGNSFNHPILAHVLPDSLQTIKFGRGFMHYIEYGSLPKSLQSIHFQREYKYGIQHKIGDNNEYNGVINNHKSCCTLPISFSIEYEQEGPNLSNPMGPVGIQRFKFSRAFSKSIPMGWIPSTITHLTFGAQYDKEILPGVLPNSITHLHLGQSYNHPLKPKVLPTSLRYLTMSNDYNQPLVEGTLPNQLIQIKFGPWFDQVIKPNVLPSKLEILEFGAQFNHPLTINVLPKTLTRIVVGNNMKSKIEPPTTICTVIYSSLALKPIERFLFI